MAVKVDFAGFGAAGGADDAAVLEDIHHAGRAAVADLQAALEQGGAGLALAADDLDAVLHQFLVLLAVLVVESRTGFCNCLVDLDLVAGFALLGDEVDDVLDLLVGDERALGADQSAEPGGR
jgi:hypothetical protein